MAATFTLSYDAESDVLTIDGHKIAGELLRSLTRTPCGEMFRVVERRDGAITVSAQIDPLGLEAPALLGALEAMVSQSCAWARECGTNLEDANTLAGQIWRQARDIRDRAHEVAVSGMAA